MIGQVIGDYRVTAALGEGGMGMVYKGEHTALGQIVAIKSLHSSLLNHTIHYCGTPHLNDEIHTTTMIIIVIMISMDY